MIYRIIGEDYRGRWVQDPPDSNCWENAKFVRMPGRLCGAMWAGFDGWDDLPSPRRPNPRARFWFTERGWRDYGRHILADAVRSGRNYRLLVQKNPPRSQLAYRDRWQVALLPPGKK